MATGQIVAEVIKHPAQHCVLTGGEPMIAKGIRDLAHALRAVGKHITIETAGTVMPDEISCDLASLSPKLSNSAPDQRLPDAWRQKHEQLRWQPEIIREWISRYTYQLKFVVTSARDIEEIQLLLREVNQIIPPSKVLLMPEGTSAGVIRGRDETLVELCKRNGYRYCNRLHVDLFGHKRGT
jgi:7-carboxy-7-deazaguanine synthase